jgi:molybdopterin molybdotransferase
MDSTHALAPILSFQDARQLVDDYARERRPRGRESVPLADALGRVLAEPIVADRDLPPFPRSTRDGFAVRSADLAEIPTRLRLAGEIKAGDPREAFPGPLQPADAVSIMTGAALPGGADAVVMVEYTTTENQVVTIQRAVAAGENVVAQGSEAAASAVIAPRGSRINHAIVAAAASVGKSSVEVFARPRVAILCTGDEVVPVDAAPAAHQIRNSNGPSLAAQVSLAGGEPVLLQLAPDEPKALRKLIAQGLDASLLLITGGVSMGKYDFVESVLEAFAPEFYFTGALIQPGKPIVFADALRPGSELSPFYVPLFGLPGNPVSTMVTFELFVRPVLAALCGYQSSLRFPQVRLKTELRTRTGLTRFLPALLGGELSETTVEPVSWKGSGDVVSAAAANCYIVVPPDRDCLEVGEMVSIMIPGADL